MCWGNRLLHGRTCKVMVQRAWIQGRKVVRPYLQSICNISFFLHYNISEIYLIINVVLEWLQTGFPSNYSRDNLCLLLPVTWSMTNLKPLSSKFFLAWFLASCSYFRGHFFFLSLHSVPGWKYASFLVLFSVCQDVFSFFSCWYHQFSSVQSLSRVRLFATPWIAAYQASLSITNNRS